MYSYEYLERMRSLLEQAYDIVGLDDETARRCDDRVIAIIQKYGPGEETCERILDSLAKVGHSPASLDLLVETVGESLEAVRLPRYVLSERERRAAEGWGIMERPTPNPQSTPVVHHAARSKQGRFIQMYPGHVMDCDACTRQMQDVLYVVGRKEVCHWCFDKRLRKANKVQVEVLYRCRRIYT